MNPPFKESGKESGKEGAREGGRENAKDGRKTIRVVLAEDQGMVLGALAALLEIEGDISVVGQARNGKEALEAVLAHKPDVFITDIEMPHMSGLDVAAELKRRRTGTRVVIVTTFARSGYLRRALEAGASGYLLKDMRCEELADAVRRVHQGLRVIHPELATEAWGEMDPLTDRERQVLDWRAKAWPAGISLASWDCPTARCGIIFPKQSASWGRAIAWKRRGSRGPRDGCKNRRSLYDMAERGLG